MKFKNILAFLFAIVLSFSLIGCEKKEKHSVLVKYNPEDINLVRAVTFDPNKDPNYPTEKRTNKLEDIKNILETINDQPSKKTAPNPITKFDITFYLTTKDGAYHTYILTNDNENGYRVIYNNLSYQISEKSYKQLHDLYSQIDANEATTEIQNLFK